MKRKEHKAPPVVNIRVYVDGVLLVEDTTPGPLVALKETK